MELHKIVLLFLASGFVCSALRRSDERFAFSDLIFRRMRNAVTETPRHCEAAALSMAKVEDNIDLLVSGGGVSKEFVQQMLKRLIGDNSWKDIICSLEGVSTISEAKSKMDDLGVTRNVFGLFYLNEIRHIMKKRYDTLQALAGHIAVPFCETRAACEQLAAVYNNTDASGLLNLDEEGREWFMAADPYGYWYKDYEPTTYSVTGCRPLLIGIYLLEADFGFNSEQIFGVTLPSIDSQVPPDPEPYPDASIQYIIFEAAQSGGLDGLFQVFDKRLHYILDGCLSKYPQVQQHARHIISLAAETQRPPHPKHAMELLFSLQAMGLLDLDNE